MRRSRLLWTALALLLSIGADALASAGLRPLSVVSFGPERGLSGHPVTALAQDRWSRLWVGTLGGGAFRYDGLSWRPITTRDGLLSDRITTLVPGAHGEMWISTAPGNGSRGGLVVAHEDRLLPPIEGDRWEAQAGLAASDGTVWFALRAGGVARYTGSVLEPVAGLETVRVARVVETRDNTLWFLGRPLAGGATAPGTLHRLEGTSFRALGEAEGLPRAPLRALLEDRQGRLWLGGASGLFVLQGGRFEPWSGAASAALARDVHALFEDADGVLWAGLEGGALRIAHEIATELKLPPDMTTLPVLAIGASPSGGVFLMTPTHLMRLEGQAGEALALSRSGIADGDAADDPQDRLRAESALDELLETNGSLLVDHEGGVWAIDGSRIVRYAGDEARRYGRDEGLPSEDVRAVHVDSRGLVWCGTAAGAARLHPETGLFEPVSGTRDAVEALYEDRGGAVYAATAASVLRIDGLDARPWPPASGLERVHAFVADTAGRLWIGSDEGLARSSAEGLERFGPAEGTAAGPVLCLASIDGELWAGHDGGLSHLLGSRFESLPRFHGVRVEGLVATGSSQPPRLLAVTSQGLRSVPDGLPAGPPVTRTALHAAHRSPSSVLWLALDVGVLKTSEGAEVLHAGGTFPSVPVRAFAEDTEGRVWLATRRGLYRHAPRRGPPAARIVQALGGSGGEPGTPIVLRGSCRDLVVRYAGVSFIGPRDAADLRFETRLRPRESAWSAPSDARFRALQSLEAGSYTLEVRAVSRDLLRSATATLPFTVGSEAEQPPPPKLVLPPVARP